MTATRRLPARLRTRARRAALAVPADNPALDAPHPFQQAENDRPGWCVCGRIEAIGIDSPIHNDDEGRPL